jgi:hypothetical protein
MVDVAKHKKGGSVRYENHEGKTYICCKDLFQILNLAWSNRKVRKLETRKIKTCDSTGRRHQIQTFLLAQDAERFMQKSKRVNKALWLHRTFLAHKQFTSLSKTTCTEPKNKKNAELEVMNKALTQQLLKSTQNRACDQSTEAVEEAKGLLDNYHMPPVVKDFLVTQFKLESYVQEKTDEENRLREIDRKRESGEDQKVEELPATLEPHKWSKDKIHFRWIEHEGVTWLEVESFCSAMKYGRPYCTIGYKHRDFEGVYLAEHRGDSYVNANVLRWHRMTVPQYETGRVAVLEHFMA